MSETITGSKSSRYIKENIPGITDSSDTLVHVSVQDLWEGRGAMDVIPHGVYPSTAIPFIIAAGSVKRYIKVVGHGASVGDFIRMNNGSADGHEVTIVKIVDVDTFVISKEIPASIGDELFILKPVTPSYAKDGSLTVSSGPTKFILDSVTSSVTEDTVAPANNKPMPSKLFIHKNGVDLPVNKDTATPANTVAIPVEIVQASGTVINITAGDIDIHTSDAGVNFDSMRIGDGTNLLGINASNEAKTRDADAITQLTAINTNTDGLEGKLDTLHADLGALLTELDTKASLTDTQPVSMAAAPVGASLEATQLLVKAKTDNLDVALSTRNEEATQLLIKAKTDNLDVALSTVATNADLLLMSAKFPASLGSKTSANSLSITLASDEPNFAVEDLQVKTVLDTISTVIGNKTDAVATTDTGNFSLIALVKRSLQHLSASRTKVANLFNDYTVTPVTTGAYVELISSTSSAAKKLEVFDSSGQVLIFAIGAAASEVDQLYIFPGGNGFIDLEIPSGSRISVKAKTGTANVGLLAINIYA